MAIVVQKEMEQAMVSQLKTPEELAEEYALRVSAMRMEELFYKSGDNKQMLDYVNKRTDQIQINIAEGYLAGFREHERRAEVLVKALEEYATADDDPDNAPICHAAREALEAYRTK